MDSNTVYEYDVTTPNAPPLSVADVPIIGDSEPSASSDSESDFESDITTALIESGRSRIASGDACREQPQHNQRGQGSRLRNISRSLRC
jgi:hypothetical protein